MVLIKEGDICLERMATASTTSHYYVLEKTLKRKKSSHKLAALRTLTRKYHGLRKCRLNFDDFKPLYDLWLEYISSVIDKGETKDERMLKADYHGCILLVTEASNKTQICVVWWLVRIGEVPEMYRDFCDQRPFEIRSRSSVIVPVENWVNMSYFGLGRWAGPRIPPQDLLRYAHASAVLLPLQKPFSSGKKISHSQWTKIVQLAVFSSFIQVLWFYGITQCGPLRAILIFEHSDVVVIAVLTVIAGSGGPSKVRGAVLLCIGFLSLVVLDRDITVDHNHDDHSRHGGLNHLFYHVINWFGVADHKAGVLLLMVALFSRAGCDNAFKKIAVEVGGAKRLHSITTLISALLLSPWALITVLRQSHLVHSWLEFFLFTLVAMILVFVWDFYSESISFHHLSHTMAARWCPMLMFISAFAISHLWFEPYRTASTIDLIHGHGMATVEHGLSGGVVFTLILFLTGTYILTSATSPKARTGTFVGWSSSGLPLYNPGEDFLQKTSQSILSFAKSTLRQILSSSDSRRIFYFLCLNLAFCGVEFAYGALTNSLGLISDGFHMFFDCSALVMGLVASVMTRWKPTRLFSYGYGRVEVLSGFINALFLIVIAFFIFLEALERLYDPPEVHTEKLLVVSVAGLLVNLFGIFSFSHAHSHGGGDSHGHSHGHSHGESHGHSHGGKNANMQGVFLHVLADTLGSVFVIISSLLIQNFGWNWVDPFCSLILSALIFMSVVPLLKESSMIILQRTPSDYEQNIQIALDKILHLEGVISHSHPHLWELNSEKYVGSLSVQVTMETHQQKITQQVLNLLREAGVTQPTVQVEKETFFQNITALCPAYEVPYKSKKLLHQTLFVKAI